MVNIDTVYQKVLMLVNKEQRGYITPQEFNLFADQAQKEIFEQYFYDLNQFSRIHGQEAEYIDIVTNINEKISGFETTSSITSGSIQIGTDPLYRLGAVYSGSGMVVEEVQQSDLAYMLASPLLEPSISHPVYVRLTETTINSYPNNIAASCDYIRTPVSPSWAYVVVGGKAMRDSTSAINFELHPAEESELVYKILKYAGISMDKINIFQAGQVQEQSMTQQEKQ